MSGRPDSRLAGLSAPPDAPAPHGPRIVFPPPLLYALGFLAGIVLHDLAPGDTIPPALSGAARTVGIALALAGATLSLYGVGTFFRAKTTTIPHRAAATLVTHGPYRFTRNPMYVGLTTVYMGMALALNRLWPFTLLPGILAILILAVIRLEEAHLLDRFGDDYRDYCARVRRFL